MQRDNRPRFEPWGSELRFGTDGSVLPDEHGHGAAIVTSGSPGFLDFQDTVRGIEWRFNE